ncbi:hypothetical protein [Kaistia sp. UC242_56]|uniref:hypothetical protein n=1 Tax=Kaistia sp. UC242_56 TaxID=3374625 RepID=UPI0037999B34
MANRVPAAEIRGFRIGQGLGEETSQLFGMAKYDACRIFKQSDWLADDGQPVFRALRNFHAEANPRVSGPPRHWLDLVQRTLWNGSNQALTKFLEFVQMIKLLSRDPKNQKNEGWSRQQFRPVGGAPAGPWEPRATLGR